MKIIFAVFALFFSIVVSATPLNKIVVFGDSLSDNGNLYEFMKHELPVSPPYYKGRFTNGPVWVELLAETYYPNDAQVHLLDYAFGGAGISEDPEDDDDDSVLFTLRREVDSYLLSHQDKADPNSLYVFWMGSNNYLVLPENEDATVAFVIEAIKRDLERLIQKGATHLLVITIPDLGKTPAARDYDAVDKLTSITEKHNNLLKQTINSMKLEYPHVRWFYVDVNEIVYDILDFPERFGITNTVDTCYEEMLPPPSELTILKMASTVSRVPRQTVDACTGFLFFDPFHPTETTHQEMARRVKKMLDDEGILFR